MKLKTSLVFGVAMLIASSASAQELYDWGSAEVPVMVKDGSGVLFVGKDKTVWRVFSWKKVKGKERVGTIFIDLDKDGKMDVIGAGKPTFVLNNDADPVWVHKKGCDQVLVADLTADDSRDLACLMGRKISVFTHDGQFAWGIDLGGRPKYCRVEDVNGDLKADIECAYKKSFTRIDGTNGDVLADSADSPLAGESKLVFPDALTAKSLAGEEQFDFNEDGTPEESIFAVDDSAVVVKSRSSQKALARIETKGKPLAALVKDLDGDKKLEIVILTKKSLFIASPDGKEVKSFGLNTKKYKRQPVARIEGAYANGFESDTDASAAVTALNAKLAKCYTAQVRKNKFAGQGQVLLEVSVNKKGKAKSVNVTHSALPSKKVVKCAQGVLKKGKYPNAAEDTGMINVRLFYTFRDQ